LGFRVNAYAFRRYVATHLNTKGKDIKDIQQYLGHTRPTTTLRYIERSCVLTDVCAGVMGEVF
ncbi:site-specific integrase, partial [Patescibacteria group bacterium]